MNLKQEIKDVIYNALNDLEISYEKENITIEVPKKRENGDFSSNIAMQLSRILKRDPKSIAQDIKKRLEKSDGVLKVEVAPPGFINIFLKVNIAYILCRSWRL